MSDFKTDCNKVELGSGGTCVHRDWGQTSLRYSHFACHLGWRGERSEHKANTSTLSLAVTH